MLLSCNAATKRALLIGISDYPISKVDKEASWHKIHGANDVLMLGRTLKAQGFKISSLTNSNATADRIRKALRKLLSDASNGDIIYLHFSCHGQPVEDVSGDENDGWDEAIIPYDAWKKPIRGIYDGKNHILDDELNTYLRSLRSKVGTKGFVYVVIDACHAGSSYRSEEEGDSIIIRGTDSGFSLSGKMFVPKIDKRGKIKVEKSHAMADVCILEACRSYQVNSEIRERGNYYGSLSFYVDKVLRMIKLDKNISWTNNVVELMNKDTRLVRQNLVIESSL